jgi:Dolichyl-phosphate-mannose-protein mannosyltransferase
MPRKDRVTSLEYQSGETAPAPVPPTGPRHGGSGEGPSATSVAVLAVVLVAAVLVGVFVRIWILGNQPINGDEATPGLMAHQILRGHPSAFYWGQDYGSGEPYVVALLFAIAGQSAFTLNLTPALLSVAAAVVVWRIGLRLIVRPAALVAAVLSWVWGEAVVWNSVREIGFRGVTLLCGLLVLLFSLRVRGALVDGHRTRLNWVGVGFFAGVGWWASPEIAYFVVPAAVFLALALRAHGRRGDLVEVCLGLGAFLVGALPWLVTTLRGADTFRQQASPVNYVGRLQLLFTHAVPIALGLRIEGEGNWLWSAAFGVTLLIVLAAATLGACVVLASGPSARLLVFFVCSFPLLYAAFSATFFWNDARYVVYLTPVLSLLWVGALWKAARWAAAWCAVVVLVAAMASTLISFNDSYGALNSASAATSWTANPNQALTGLGSWLEARGVHSVLADYWVANPLTFLTGSTVVALDPASTRNPPAVDSTVHEAGRTWIFVNPALAAEAASALGVPGALSPGGLTVEQVETWAHAHDVTVESSDVGPFVVLRLFEPVSVAEVAAAT